MHKRSKQKTQALKMQRDYLDSSVYRHSTLSSLLSSNNGGNGTTATESMDVGIAVSSSPMNLSTIPNHHQDDVDSSMEHLFLEHMILDPTPIKLGALRIVKEVKLGSLWRPEDRVSAQLFKSILLQQNDDRGGAVGQGSMDYPAVPQSYYPNDGGGMASDICDYNLDLLTPLPLSIESNHFMDDKLKSRTDAQKSDKNNADNDNGSAFSTGSASLSRSSSMAWSNDDFEEDDSVSTTTPQGTQRQDQWRMKYKELEDFYKLHGHCLVPHRWSQNKSLSQWVKRQRYQYKLLVEGKSSTMNEERIKELSKLDFQWSSRAAIWEERFKELEDFARQHGHCNVSSTYEENRHLSIWVRCQRYQYKLFIRNGVVSNDQQQQGGDEDDAADGVSNNRKTKEKQKKSSRSRRSTKSCMTKERVMRLKSLGFSFNPRQMKL